jgi:glutamate racemase
MSQASLFAPLGVFDSGVGGLSVLRAIRRELPGQPILYLADQAHVPYGARPLEEVYLYSETITRYLLEQGARLVVVACNTASAAALQSLRKTFPEVPFVGMEPALKPAAENTRSGAVGVLATPATFQSALYASVVERFAHGVRVLQDTCPGLVCQIEAGNLDGSETRQILESAVLPMLDAGIDAIVLGCTHYPFVIPMIEEIVYKYFQEPPETKRVRVIDPAPAVARQVHRLLDERGWLAASDPARILPVRYLTTGNAQALQELLPRLIAETGQVEAVTWQDGRLVGL